MRQWNLGTWSTCANVPIRSDGTHGWRHFSAGQNRPQPRPDRRKNSAGANVFHSRPGLGGGRRVHAPPVDAVYPGGPFWGLTG